MKILTLGIILVIIGVMFIFIGSITSIVKGEKNNIRSAGGIFIGPIPIFGFFTDKKMFYLLIGLMVIAFILFYLLRRF